MYVSFTSPLATSDIALGQKIHLAQGHHSLPDVDMDI